AASSRTERFTVNFTMTNLSYSTSLRNPHSAHFIATSRGLSAMLDRVLKNSSISPAYRGCTSNVSSPRAKKDRDSTGVDAICSYRDEPSGPRFDRVAVYHQLRNMTNGFTKLGHYSLSSQSLYVNG
ncbi:MUC16 protein, partial [Alcedo cyanopectus]|nr:MUC16 protein [Ceyx cyanopectus]